MITRDVGPTLTVADEGPLPEELPVVTVTVVEVPVCVPIEPFPLLVTVPMIVLRLAALERGAEMAVGASASPQAAITALSSATAIGGSRRVRVITGGLA